MARWFSIDALRAVDRLAAEEFGLPTIVLMENAAAALEASATAMIGRRAGPAVVCCGPGNNGGDGYALARRLHNAGVPVRIVAVRDVEDHTGDALVSARVIDRMNLPVVVAREDHEVSCRLDPRASVVVDALLGTGAAEEPRGAVRALIEAVNAHAAPVLAADLPSGLHADSGVPFGACVRATETVSFAGMKLGFASSASRVFTGAITIGDLGVPRELLDRLATRR